MSSEQPKIGKILDGPSCGRDAVHVAIAPVRAGQFLMPGWHVGIDKNGVAVCNPDDNSWEEPVKMIGIVDPFIDSGISTGKWFYLFLYPGTITTLRHVWTSPAFPSAKAPVPNE